MSASVLIPLTMGRFAIVDAEDAPRLRGYSWQCVKRGATFYAKRREGPCGGRTIYMHREIFGDADSVLVDHRNRDGLDNRRRNLRAANKGLNAANSGPHADNGSGFKGVSFDKSRGLWAAKIHVNGKHKFIGRFPTAEQAALAYNDHAKRAWGEFAFQNDVSCLKARDEELVSA